MKFFPRRFFLHLVLLPSTLLWTLACSSVDSTSVDSPSAASAAGSSVEAPVQEPKVLQPVSTDAPTASVEKDAEDASSSDLQSAPLDARLPLTDEVVSGRLDNGVRYFIRAHAQPKDRAELRLMINAGSLQEDEDQLGLAHFLEHMAFNGTENFARNELVEYMERIGMRFGADVNAYTSFDETVYMLTIPTDDEEIVATAFQILEDWAHGIVLDPEEVDKERGVVVEEWRLGRGASARRRDEQFPVLFRGSRYAERLPIGEVEIIENAPPEALQRFYDEWYRPDLMAVVAVGDFDSADVERRIQRHFADIEPVDDPPPREPWPVPDHEETLWASTVDPEIRATTAAVYTKLPAQGEGTYGDYRRSLVEGLYNGMLNQRLAEVARRATPPFLFAGASKAGLVRSKSVFTQTVAVHEGEVLRGLEALLDEIERVDRHGFTAGELERAKSNMRRGYEQMAREHDKLPSSSLAAELGRHFFVGEPVPGILAETALVERFLPGVSLEEVNAAASSWIIDENRVILLSGPEKEGVELPAKEEVLALFEAVEQREIEPWVDEVKEGPLLSIVPEKSTVVEREEISEIGVVRWKLRNGIQIILKPTDFRNDQILVSGWSDGGTSLVDDEDYLSATMASTIVGQSGLGEMNLIELDKALAGTVAGASTYIASLEEGVSASGSPEDVETMFQLLFMKFVMPRLDLETYSSMLDKWNAALKNRSSSPGAVFGDRMGEVLSQGHYRALPLTQERLPEIDPQRAFEIYRDRFADASDFTFVIVGNFDPEELRPLVETYIGGLPTLGREETWRDVGMRPPPGEQRVEVRKGIEPKSQVQMIFHGETEWSMEKLHVISTLGRALTMRLREVLREDLGATYGVGVGGQLVRRPYEGYRLSISFGCDPAEVESLLETLDAELAAIRADGLDPSYLEKVEEAQRRKREVDLQQNGFWLSVLESYTTFGIDPRRILEYERLLDAATPESLHETAKYALDPSSRVVGVLYPESEDASGVSDGGEGGPQNHN